MEVRARAQQSRGRGGRRGAVGPIRRRVQRDGAGHAAGMRMDVGGRMQVGVRIEVNIQPLPQNNSKIFSHARVLQYKRNVLWTEYGSVHAAVIAVGCLHDVCLHIIAQSSWTRPLCFLSLLAVLLTLPSLLTLYP